jgi:hypothetical protein
MPAQAEIETRPIRSATGRLSSPSMALAIMIIRLAPGDASATTMNSSPLIRPASAPKAVAVSQMRLDTVTSSSSPA